jgi:NADP-dependent 3-hydroxy acid dehydrogenase YdfG/Tfp pilus assembly protein PilF
LEFEIFEIFFINSETEPLMTKLILAYCTENQMVAAKIASALKEKATIEKVVFDFSTGMEALRKATYTGTAPVLLLVSDNFLKSENCMNDALPLIQSLGTAQRLITVTTEGSYQENGRPVIMPTSFDRVSNVIQYMNHWQDRYLDLRRKKSEGDEVTFNEKVRVVRTISSEIGELLRYLRSTEYYSFDQFEDSNYIVLYRVLGIPVSEEMAISARPTNVHHTALPTEMVNSEVLEPALAEEEAYNPFANGVHFGSKNGTTETNNYLEALLSDQKTAPTETENLPNTAHGTVSDAADKMKELASNGVNYMKEPLAEIAEMPTQVVDNQSPTSDFQIRANELINDGLDRPSSLESMIAGMRDEKSVSAKHEVSENVSRQVDAIFETEKATVEKNGFSGFTLEQILKDDELKELLGKEDASIGETLATEPVQNGMHSDALTMPRSSNGNGNGLHVDLDDSDSDLVKQIAAEAEREFQEKMRLKALAESPTKVEDIVVPIVAPTISPIVDIVPTPVVEVENFVEKADADFRDLTENVDAEDIKSEVTRILDEAEEPATHFEFEENINDKLTEETAALFEQPAAPKSMEKIVNQLVIERSMAPSTPFPTLKDEPLIQNEPSEPENDVYPRKLRDVPTEGSLSEVENVQKLMEETNEHPDDNAARYQLAAELAQQSRLTEATEQLEILLETDRKNVEAYVLLAYLAEQQGDHTLSLNSLEKVALLNPDYPGIYYKLGQLTKEHFKKQSRKALRYFQDAVAQDPSNADAQYRLGVMLIEQKGEHATAIEHFTRAVESAPQHDGAAFELAKSYVETGNQQLAAAFYSRATELNGTYKTEVNDLIFHYEEPLPEPIVIEEPVATVNDNGITVMITGATAGIGRATAEVFAKNGYRLVLTGRRNERLEEIKTAFETTYNNRIQILNFDVRNLEGIKTAVSELEEDFKNVDILINNAGLASGLSPIHEGDVADWELMIDTNIKGLLYVTRAVAPSMVARKKGHIINLSSIAGKEIYPNGNVYIATKHAVDALTKAMRVDLHKYGIRVSQVAPGAVEETEFALVRFHGDAEKAKIYDDFTPLKASDVAESIYFIASRAEYVNIQDIVLAGTQQAAAAFVDRSGRTDK